MSKNIREERGINKLITYEPGNRTRYEILLADVPGMPSVVGFCWLNPISGPQGRFRILQRTDAHGPLHYSYFMQKVDCCAADAAPLLVLLHEELGRTVILPPGYDAHGIYVGGDPDMQEPVTKEGRYGA